MRDLNRAPTTVGLREAIRAVESGHADGIGLSIVANRLCGLDLDHCVLGGRIDRWAMDLLQECDSYAEYSPSGTGIHILLQGTPRGGNHTQVAVGNGHVDFFASTGYLTLTGNPVEGYAQKPLRPEASIFEGAFQRFSQLSHAIKIIRNHDKFSKLWGGDTSDYESPSEADLALVAYAGKLLNQDPSKVEEVWRQSGLYREKLERPDYVRRTIAKGVGSAPANILDVRPDDFVYPMAEFLDEDFPPPEWVVEGFLEKGTLNMVFGIGGVGKSHFLYSLMKSLDQGERFMYWPVKTARRVLYIDTEMPEGKIQQRVRDWFGDKQPLGCNLITGARYRKVVGSPFALDDPAHQDLLRKAVTELMIDVLVVDPIAPALVRSDENSNNDVSNYMPFLLELRDLGLTIILSHHSGKSDESGQRGASRRRDYLDLNIKLGARAGVSDKTAIFEVSFDKVRGEKPEPPKWVAELAYAGCHFWELRHEGPEGNEDFLRVLGYLVDHAGEKINVTKMARALMLERTRLYDSYFKPARAKGYLNRKGYDVTDSGRALVKEWRSPA